MIARHGAVRDIRRDHDQRQQPRLWIHETFENLLRLHNLVLDSGLVLAQPLNGPELLFACQELAADGTVWQERQDRRSETHGDEAYDEEEDLPAGEDFALVVLEAEAEKRADHGADADTDVPEAYAPGLFGFLRIVSDELVNSREGQIPCTT